MTIQNETVLAALRHIAGPDGNSNIVDLGLVSDIFSADGKVYFSITVPAEKAQALEPMRSAAEKAVSTLPGVKKSVATLTAARAATRGSAQPPSMARPSHAPAGHSHAGHSHGVPQQQGRGAIPAKAGVPGIGKIIAVASGKGGVGKSTTAVNLALGLKANGLRVGVMDADIYGPSMPKLLGLSGRPQQAEGRRMKPLNGYGMPVMSMGFLVEEDTPMIWRGPMVMSALTQMLREVEWGELDVLVVDMPPGTGDAQLTMAQQVPLAGAVIVSTPQDLALIDARKGLNMFRRVEVPVLGIVENMSYFIAPDTGKRYDIFGHGGAKAEAARLGVPFLGEVPLEMMIRETSDKGLPVVASEPDGPHARIYRDIAHKVWAGVAAVNDPGPSIVFE